MFNIIINMNFFRRNNKKDKISLVDQLDNNYLCEIKCGKGKIGIAVEKYKSKRFKSKGLIIKEIRNEELKDQITLDDKLFKINNIELDNLSLKEITDIFHKLENKTKTITILRTL